MGALTLPIARLRAAGYKVSPIVGHGPITTGSHPLASSRWYYGITPPDGVVMPDIEDALWRYDRSWSGTHGEAIAYNFRDGRIMVQATAAPDPKATKPAQIRAVRQHVEQELATMLDRIATVLT